MHFLIANIRLACNSEREHSHITANHDGKLINWRSSDSSASFSQSCIYLQTLGTKCLKFPIEGITKLSQKLQKIKCSLFFYTFLIPSSKWLGVCITKGREEQVKRARTRRNIKISDKREAPWLTLSVSCTNSEWLVHRRPHSLIAERHSQTVHKQCRHRAHTWKALTVQTREEAFLFCRRHSNLQGGWKTHTGLCSPTALHCPVCLCNLLTSLWWHMFILKMLAVCTHLRGPTFKQWST